MVYFNIFVWALVGTLAVTRPISPALFMTVWFGALVLYFRCLVYEKLSTEKLDKDKKKV